MNATSLLFAIGSIGLFSSRVFLPAFITALLLRFGGHLPLVHNIGLIAHAQGTAPSWFTSNPSLIILGVLSLLETVAQKNPEARNFLHQFDVHLKTALAFLTSLGVISSTDAGFASHAAHQAGSFEYAGMLEWVGPLIAAVGTFRVSLARRKVMIALFEHVDGTHLDHFIDWAEDAWVAFGAIFLVLFPVLMLLLIAIATAVLFIMRHRLAVAEERSRIACAQCGTSLYACAVACPRCKAAVPSPADVGFLGQSLVRPAQDLSSHRFRLVEKRRCPVCATRLRAGAAVQTCATCGSGAVGEQAFSEQYLAYLGRRVPVVLGVSFLMSLIPVIGMIAGAVYYRMALVLPIGQFLPPGRRFLLRWGIRLLFFVMVFLQLVPILGGLVVPLMAMISFGAYRGSYLSLLEKHHRLPAGVPASA